MKIKANVILIIVLILTAILLISLPSVTAEDITKGDKVVIQPDNKHEITIETGEGKIKYSWDIENFNDDKNLFYHGKKGDSRDQEFYDNASLKGEISVKKGKYVFGWKNNNANGSFTINYKITYPKPPEGCYSSILILSTLSLASIVWISGKTKRY